MDKPVASCVIKDRLGNDHAYELYPTPAGEALDQTPELLTMFGPPIDAIRAALGGTSSFSDALDNLAGLVLKMGGHKKAIELLKYTKRDELGFKGTGPKAGLMAFNYAYSHNLAECVSALRWVIGETYGDFFSGGSGLIGPKLTKALEDLKTTGLSMLKEFTSDLKKPTEPDKTPPPHAVN